MPKKFTDLSQAEQREIRRYVSGEKLIAESTVEELRQMVRGAKSLQKLFKF